MATDKQHVATWQQTNDKLLTRTFDEGTNYVLVQQLEGPNESVDRFVLREDTMLDRDDVVLQAGIVKATVQADVLDLTWPAGNTGGPLGLGYKVQPTNFALPAGYAITYETDGTLVYTKATTSSTTKNVAANAAETEAAKEGFFAKYWKWLAGGAVVLIGGLFAIRATNGKKKRR